MPISWTEALGMRLRNVPVRRMRAALRTVEEHRLPVTLEELEAHHLAGGDIERVLAFAVANPISREQLKMLFAADLMGEDLEQFARRGYRTEQQIHLEKLRSAAADDIGTARELYAILADAHKTTLERLSRVSKKPWWMPANLQEGLVSSLTSHNDIIMQEMAQLRACWPDIEGEPTGPAV